MPAIRGGFNRSLQHIILIKKKEVLEMKHRTRTHYIEAQKSMMWDRWQKGDSLHEIARMFDRGPSSIARILS